ncbi:MAG: hypothetical protein ACE5GS_00775 [Kiloniellaceae bacterium]
MPANKTKPLLTGTFVLLSVYVVFQIATWVNRSLDGEHPGPAIEVDRPGPTGGPDATDDRRLGERDSPLAELLRTVEDAARRAAGSPPAGGPKRQDASSSPGGPAPIAEAHAPQFAFGPVGATYEAGYRDLRAVDFANLTYRPRGIAPDLSIPLRNGAYDAKDGLGFERAELLDRRVCDNPALESARAVVRLRYASGAGSSTCDEVVQIFRVRDGRLAVLHEIVYACAPEGAYEVDCARGEVSATASAWLGSDPNCCPSALDTAVFSFVGRNLRLLSWTRVGSKAPTGPVR